jgi:hypothetical protein
MAEGKRLELSSPCGRRISSAVPYQLDYPSAKAVSFSKPARFVKRGPEDNSRQTELDGAKLLRQ